MTTLKATIEAINAASIFSPRRAERPLATSRTRARGLPRSGRSWASGERLPLPASFGPNCASRSAACAVLRPAVSRGSRRGASMMFGRHEHRTCRTLIHSVFCAVAQNLRVVPPSVLRGQDGTRSALVDVRARRPRAPERRLPWIENEVRCIEGARQDPRRRPGVLARAEGSMILVALDGSARAPAVLAKAIAVASAQGERLVLLRSIGLPADVPQDFWRSTDESLLDLLDHRAKAYLEECEAKVPTAVRGGTQVVIGSPWQSICETAHRLGCDLDRHRIARLLRHRPGPRDHRRQGRQSRLVLGPRRPRRADRGGVVTGIKVDPADPAPSRKVRLRPPAAATNGPPRLRHRCCEAFS